VILPKYRQQMTLGVCIILSRLFSSSRRKNYFYSKLSTQPINENEPRPLAERQIVYDVFLNMLALSEEHRDSLLKRGLDYAAIGDNKYRTAPRIVLADSTAESLSKCCDLTHGPGFYTHGRQGTVRNCDE